MATKPFTSSLRFLFLLLTLILTLCLNLLGCGSNKVSQPQTGTVSQKQADTQTVQKEPPAKDRATSLTVPRLDENGAYTKPEEVAEYIHTYRKLPANFMTKKQATDLGWVSEKGNLWLVTDRKSIGGDKFGNFEGRLPKASGRQWYECDVNYAGGFRGGERVIYSNDGMIYYSRDHYQTFKRLY